MTWFSSRAFSLAVGLMLIVGCHSASEGQDTVPEAGPPVGDPAVGVVPAEASVPDGPAVATGDLARAAVLLGSCLPDDRATGFLRGQLYRRSTVAYEPSSRWQSQIAC